MKLRYSEIFYSIQGEGRFLGAPSVFLRTFGCNFRCMGFGQPRDRRRWVPEEQMPYKTQDLSQITDFKDLPVVPIGCDSSASWAARFRHLSTHEDVDTIAQTLRSHTPDGAWIGASGAPIHLVITGGEPLLVGWQRVFPALLAAPGLAGLQHLTFETNGTQPLHPTLRQTLDDPDRGFHLNWSVSPKLRRSGEDPAQAIRPGVLAEYASMPDGFLYLKFVVEDEADVQELMDVTAQYRDRGVQIDAVYAMPVGALAEDYEQNRNAVATLCLKYGVRFSPRLHVDLFGNRFGT
ncbi:MAG: 7-carboxy-7-deazaguanine synthase QueE [Myxococcota bacterium]